MELMQQPQPLPPFPWQPTDQCGTRYGTTPPPKSFAPAQQNPPDLPARPNIPRVQSLPFRPDMSRVQSLLFNDEIFLQFVDDELLVPQDPTSAASTPVVASQQAPVPVPQVPSTSAPAPVVAPALPPPVSVMSTQHPASSLQPSCSLDDVQLSNFVDDMLSDFHDEGFVF